MIRYDSKNRHPDDEGRVIYILFSGVHPVAGYWFLRDGKVYARAYNGTLTELISMYGSKYFEKMVAEGSMLEVFP